MLFNNVITPLASLAAAGKVCQPPVRNGFDVSIYPYPLDGDSFRTKGFFDTPFPSADLLATKHGITKLNFSYAGGAHVVYTGLVYGYDTTRSNIAANLRGYFLATQSGVYKFNMAIDDGGKFSLGKAVGCCGNTFDSAGTSFTADDRASNSQTYTLEAGKYYPVEVSWVNSNGNGVINISAVLPDKTTLPDIGAQVFQPPAECMATSSTTTTSATSTIGTSKQTGVDIVVSGVDSEGYLYSSTSFFQVGPVATTTVQSTLEDNSVVAGDVEIVIQGINADGSLYTTTTTSKAVVPASSSSSSSSASVSSVASSSASVSSSTFSSASVSSGTSSSVSEFSATSSSASVPSGTSSSVSEFSATSSSASVSSGTSSSVSESSATSSSVSESSATSETVGTTSTVTHETTTIITITSCSENKCHEKAVTATRGPKTVTVEGVVSVYTTWCPSSDAPVSAKIITITSCDENQCHKATVPATPASTTITDNGQTTVYTTWCPVSSIPVKTIETEKTKSTSSTLTQSNTSSSHVPSVSNVINGAQKLGASLAIVAIPLAYLF